MNKLDATIFQGRLLHILPAQMPKGNTATSVIHVKPSPGGTSAFKQQREKDMKELSEKSFNWNTLFMASDAVAESISNKLNIPKSELLSKDADNVAVRLALAESQILIETKKFFQQVINDRVNTKKTIPLLYSFLFRIF